MKPLQLTALLLFCGLPLAAQTAASTPAKPISCVTLDVEAPPPPLTTEKPSATLDIQSPVAAPAMQMHKSELGFAYGIPADWEVVDAEPMLPALRQQEAKTASSADERKGIECANVALTARHGAPPSVIVVISLPFDCFGQTLTDNDLPGFAAGVAEGLKKTFTVTEPVAPVAPVPAGAFQRKP